MPDRRTATTRNADFLNALGAVEEVWQERMWAPQVQVHGGLATLWAPYDFHRDGVFSHCGVDAFTLLRYDDGWKIAAVAYTVEPEGCTGPPEGH